ncbi:hypothetical protein BGX38DRAFT_1223090, partial [Terfezia claveryi]
MCEILKNYKRPLLYTYLYNCRYLHMYLLTVHTYIPKYSWLLLQYRHCYTKWLISFLFKYKHKQVGV